MCMTFEENLISEYLKYGSIDKVFKIHNYDIPISFASYHRLLNKYQVIKSAGPNSKLSESLHVLSLLNTYKLPLERIYHHHSPASLQISTNTLHRVLHNVRLGVTKRVGVALLISQIDSPYKYLFGQDESLSDPQLGERGDWSLPMGYTRQQDSFSTGIKRILQQEVFTNKTIYNRFPKYLVPKNPKPLFTINIADIKVFVFKLVLTPNQQFSSFKLSNYSFYNLQEISNLKVRAGVTDIVEHYIYGSTELNYTSEFNQNLCLLPLKVKS
jgi:hypothetical protein